MNETMSRDELAHYRAACKTLYLACEDLTEPVVLTIDRVSQEANKVRPSERHNVAYFQERELSPGHALKPMILNTGNARTIAKLAKTPHIAKWSGLAITVYPDPSVKFGRETVGGLRISPERPKLEKRAFDRSNHKMFERAVAAYKRDGNCDAIETHMTMTDDDKLAIEATAKEHSDES